MSNIEARFSAVVVGEELSTTLKDIIEQLEKEMNEQRNTKPSSYHDKQHWCDCDLHSGGWKHSESESGYSRAVLDSREEQLLNLRWNLYELSDELIELMVKKNQDYGSSNIMDAPGGAENGLAVRLHDKVARLTNLLATDSKPNYESIRDTFIDIANYGMIGVLVLDGQWN